MATAKAPARNITKVKRLRTTSNLPSMDRNLLNTANIRLPASKNMVIRLSRATSLLLNHLTNNLPTVATKVATMHSLTTAQTTRPISSIRMIAQHSNTALPTTATKDLQEPAILRHSIINSSNTAEVTTANSNTLPSHPTDPQPVQATIKTTARIPASNHTTTPTHNTAPPNTATHPQGPTAQLLNLAPKTAASWALSLAAPRAVSRATR